MFHVHSTMLANLIDLYTTSDKSDKIRIETIMTLRYNQGLYVVYNWINEGGNPNVEYSGYDIDKARTELSSCIRVEGYETQDQTWYLVERLADNDVIIDSKDILAINTTTDELLYLVRKHFGGKYTTCLTKDGDTVKLRIADHSGKHRNNKGDKCLSIVIANYNPTSIFRTDGPSGISNELYFNDDYTVQDIITAIIEELLELGVTDNSND